MSAENNDSLSEIIDDYNRNLKLRVAEIKAEGNLLPPQQLVRKARQIYFRKERERNNLRDILIGLGATGIGITLSSIGERITSGDNSVHLFFVVVGLLGVLLLTIGFNLDP